MKYVMGDVHGDYLHLKQMLERIRFNPEKDHIYFLGDVVDRGPESVKTLNLVREMVTAGSATLLMGNHEYFIMLYIEGSISEKNWIQYGGKEMKEYIDTLPKEERNKLYDFIGKLPLFLELETGIYGKTILVHAGIGNEEWSFIKYKNGMISLTETMERQIMASYFNFLVNDDLHRMAQSKKFKMDHYLICGHVPTFRLQKEEPVKAYITDSYMDIDTGNGFRETNGGRLCCYCLEADKFYYI